MAGPYRAYPWGDKFTLGNIHYKNIYSGNFGYTVHAKKVASASATAVLAATNAATSVVTVTSGITNPDVPRNLTVTIGGSGVIDSVVTVVGKNIEGKTISEIFRTAAGVTGALTGNLAFMEVTSVVIGQQGSASATVSVGTGNKLGLNHRLFNQNTTVKVYTSSAMYGALTLQNAPTIVANELNVEQNTCTPVTVPNGSLIYSIFYYFDNWALAPVQDQPEYSTTTSTSSTSSSTSTTTITTSTSSTSSSISSTSTSSTSSSISTSSTSTSTTTTP